MANFFKIELVTKKRPASLYSQSLIRNTNRTTRIISCLISATRNRPSSHRRNSSRGWSVSRRNPWVAREQPNNLTLFTANRPRFALPYIHGVNVFVTQLSRNVLLLFSRSNKRKNLPWQNLIKAQKETRFAKRKLQNNNPFKIFHKRALHFQLDLS